MATDKLGILVDISVKGREGVKGAADDFKALEGTSARAASSFGSLARGFVAGTAVIAGAAVATKKLYDTLREGATLQTTQQRFDKLTNSINTTAASMLGQLRQATQGMISDMDLMASASQIINLKLADNSDQVVRLAKVVGVLNWDMSQTILTFANLSYMRLDALGLSVDEVKSKAKELEEQGMSAQAAFKEAVILAGEARLDVGGVGEAETAFKQLEAAIANSKSELSLLLVEMAKGSGLIDAMSESAARMQVGRAMREALEAGQLTDMQYRILQKTIYDVGAAQTALQLEVFKSTTALDAHDGALVANIESYRMWSGATTLAMNTASAISDTITANIIANVAAADAVLMQTVANWQGNQAAARRAAANTAFVRHDPEFMQAGRIARATMHYDRATDAVGGYTAAVSQAEQAEMALAAAHSRMADAFSAEVTGKIEEGFINADGLVNMDAANKALYEQAKAAGATASQLALLGVATGQFTEEQAQAALKAAILQERIAQIAKAVVSGGLSESDAAGALAAFSGDVNSGAVSAATGIEGMTAAAEAFANGTYEAELAVNATAALSVMDEALVTLGQLTGTHYINIVATTSGLESGPAVVPNNAPGNSRSEVVSGRSGGASNNIVVNNYVDGQVSRSAVDDITVNKIQAAMSAYGMGRR